MIKPHPKARQVPVEGGSGRYPTGAIQFKNDWPGLFVRGDNAIALLYELQAILEKLQQLSPNTWLGRPIKEIMQTIERDVILPRDTDEP